MMGVIQKVSSLNLPFVFYYPVEDFLSLAERFPIPLTKGGRK